MAPVSTAQRIQRLLSLPREKLAPLLNHPAWRWVWRALTALSLLALGLGAYAQLDKLPQAGLQMRPVFLLLALIIYLLAFLMHLMGWHRLSRLLLGDYGLREDVEAVAGSNLVKYLPTIAWYIANRAHYYGRQGVPQARVVKASLYELGFMVGGCAGLLCLTWLYQLSPALALAAPAALGLLLLALYPALRTRFGPAGLERQARRWVGAFLWYGATWPLAGLFLWAVLNAFVPVPLALLPSVLWIWAAAGLAGYAASLTLGFLAIAREITLTVLLAQLWPLPVALACAITVKLLLTLGEVTASLIALGVLRLTTRARHD